MLRNCYHKCYSALEKIWWLKLRLTVILMTICSPIWAVTQNYRLILSESPATSITIGWELMAGCPDTQRVYYDTVDHARDTSAYRFQMPITASYFHQGMENYFSTLADLKPDTRYYFVIAEDEGISDRFWFQSLSNTSSSWKALWTSSNLPQTLYDWKKLSSQIAESSLDFVLAEGFTGLTSEKDWRHWIQTWQKSISQSGRITPLLIAGNISTDVQYLFNHSKKPVSTYRLSAHSILLTSDDNGKLKNRSLKKIQPGTFVIQHTAFSPVKESEAINLILTSSTTGDDFPHRFNYPTGEMIVELSWMNGHFSIRAASGEKMLDVFSN
jgi:hypothetical protein